MATLDSIGYRRRRCGIRARNPWSSIAKTLSLEWRFDFEEAWHPFIPPASNHQQVIRSSSDPNLFDYITQDDWAKIPEIIQATLEIEQRTPNYSLAIDILVRSYKLADSGNIRYAFIESVTALELALDVHIQRIGGSSELIIKRLQRFKELPLAQRFTVVALHRGLSMQDIDTTITAIEIRNNVVHDGAVVSQQDEMALYVLLRAIAAILRRPPYRFPGSDPLHFFRQKEDEAFELYIDSQIEDPF